MQLLNRFFAVVIDEIDRHRGLVNKFQGDASLAIFGAPTTLTDPKTRPWPPHAPSPNDWPTKFPSARRASAWHRDKWSPAMSAPTNGSNTP
ncbi:putative adenylate and Guanylate cyclase catalytic domain protein [Mycobacterium kansasii 824]|uniref:Putative adenylate and Guanylate cyclase catalytic domain protein n=1 Tax=Mycobacterium kansasii TaxID=1768 RepID=A0A1V3XK21_MYCKA|nr:putative adenylate and Guanylate cyclase catalytic domain protein [Mycobacterium kansasii 824]OOK79430.1 putative adenylate and Guanylate cyclase catalytic domain protein [Mycobacterium kansasii]